MSIYGIIDMSKRNNLSDRSGDKLDDLIDKLANSKKKTEKIDVEKDDLDNYDETTRRALKDLVTVPDYYKIIGAQPTDKQSVIRELCREKLKNYHPDKVSGILAKLPVGERDKEKKKLDLQYKLIYEAYNVLKDPAKRKFYDLERKTMHNKDFLHQKSSFEDFIKLQESEISEKSKDAAKLKYAMMAEELNKKHGFKSEELKVPALSKDESDKKLSDLIDQRNGDDCEFTPKNLFAGRNFNNVEFNKHWERMKKKEAKRAKGRDVDGTIIQWEGISAANDDGLSGGDQFVSIDSNYEDLYGTGNFGASKFASRLESDSDMEQYTPSGSDDDEFDLSYVEGHNANRDAEDLERRMREFQSARDLDLDTQKNKKMTDRDYWKGVMENPHNISTQMQTIIGDDIKRVGFNKTKKVTKDKLEAYRQLVYEMNNKK
jgi:curved DNA-binding protein CbpA